MPFWGCITMLWFLILIVPTVKSQILDPYDVPQEWPSCSELRAMWLNLRKIAVMGELTNEIPLIPRELAYMDKMPRQRGRHQNTGRRFPINENQMLQQLEDLNNQEQSIFANDLMSFHEVPPLNPLISETFHEVPPLSKVRTSDQSSIPKSPTIVGFFDDVKDDFSRMDKMPFVPDDETNRKSDSGITRIDLLAYPARGKPFGQSNAFSDANVHSRGTNSFQPQWGIKDEAGLFGQFLDDDSVSRRVKSSGWHDVLKKPHSPISEDPRKIRCDAIENKKCSRNEHCLCNGWTPSVCVSGGCHVVSAADSGDVIGFGAWHDGPLAISKLGLANRRKRRAIRSILM